MRVNKPTVSVILTAYKEPTLWFSESLDSAINQTFQDLEILVMVDNPEDNKLSDIVKKKALQDNRIKLVKNERNLGLAQTLNKAIDLSSGKYICRMDADDIAKPYRVEKQLNYIRKMNYDLVGGQLEVINENGQTLYPASSIPRTSSKINSALKWNNCVAHPTWFGKREIFLKQYRNISLCEDYDFLLRASMDGFLLGNVPEIVLKYRMSSNSISRSNLYQQYLSQCYLSQQYKKGVIADPNQLDQYISIKYTKQKSNHYTKANVLFNTALETLTYKKYFRACLLGLKACLHSRSYANKILRLFCATLCR